MKTLIGKVSLALVLVLALAGGLSLSAVLSVVEFLAPPHFAINGGVVEDTTAKAFIVFDVDSGKVLASYNEYQSLPIASVTKLITAKVFSDNENIFATTSIKYSDLATEGRAGHLEYGEVYSFHELFFPLLLESSNDAASVFVRNNPELIDAMNNYADTVNLKDTNISDTSGLSEEDVSSALDVAHILTDVYKNNRHVIDITSLPAYYSGNNGWLNNNPFVNDAAYVGGKHGYTPEANYTAALLFNEVLLSGNKRVVGYVVLGSDDLENDVTILRNYVKNNVSFE